jgi:sigma-E factor negative regulatory protein RseA
MNTQALQESLSALLDNETDELELRRLLAASGDGEVRATWARYQVARAVMHKELLLPQLDLAAKVSAALADEPALVPARRRSWAGLGRMAVAASVTIAVLAGVRLYNQNDIASVQLAQRSDLPTLTAPHLQGPAVLAGYTPNAGAEHGLQPRDLAHTAELTWQQQRLPGYVRQHAQQAATVNQAVLPYARAASLDNR